MKKDTKRLLSRTATLLIAGVLFVGACVEIGYGMVTGDHGVVVDGRLDFLLSIVLSLTMRVDLLEQKR